MFYGVVESDQPTEHDFLSYAALGKPLRSQKPSRTELAAWQGVSTYVTEYGARKRAWENAQLGFPLGDFIAKLFIPEDAPIAIGPINEKTGQLHPDGRTQRLAVCCSITSGGLTDRRKSSML